MTHPTYVVHVEDLTSAEFAGSEALDYTSPPHTPAQALALVRALRGTGSREALCITDSPWTMAIPGGQRRIVLHPSDTAGQPQIT